MLDRDASALVYSFAALALQQSNARTMIDPRKIPSCPDRLMRNSRGGLGDIPSPDKAGALPSITTSRVLDGVEVHPSAPQLASNHAFI
jgi:hypothetical protein